MKPDADESPAKSEANPKAPLPKGPWLSPESRADWARWLRRPNPKETKKR